MGRVRVRGDIAQTIGDTLAVCYFEASLPLLELSALLRCPRVSRRLVVIEREVKVQIQTARYFLPYASPGSVCVRAASTAETSTSWRIDIALLARTSSNSSGQTRKRGIALDINQARLTVPDLRRIVVASTEDVNRLITPVAVHLTVCVVGCSTHNARFPDFYREQLVFQNHCWIDLGLLHLVLDGIAVDDGTADRLPQLDRVEFGTTYRTAVCALDPGLEAGVVQVVSARQ